MSEQACFFQELDGNSIYTHKECSLDPDWQEQTWDAFGLVALSEVPDETLCYLCHRLLSALPPRYWSRMSYEEVMEERVNRITR